jgi:hypothetical protein
MIVFQKRADHREHGRAQGDACEHQPGDVDAACRSGAVDRVVEH